ncbi:mechanosensitive ion channel family protein [Sphingomonas sp. CROZ-RG-20F-R02-07]|uniref:mechanosensitive ion channel family protein n=1 Tax=Sphingomonas sp. CROZ-RG-20F-R02-07 TaxID=2914832 RepID=UPI001F55F74A|nr:mechanosensitive ion channel family protein [Sphingomonas sp. CROZ-RG-20F-R02-07]
MTTTTPAAPSINPSAIWATVDGMINGFLAMLPLLGAALVVFLIFWGAAVGTRNAIERVTSQRSEYPGAGKAFGRLAYIAMMLLGLLIAVTVAFPSVTPAKLFSVLGVGGVAIGFAFKDIFQNLVAGILLLIRHPFRAGDEITSGGFTGVVESIETRATYIRTYDGQRIIVPNSIVYTQPVTVITAYGRLRSDYDFGIGNSDDVAAARGLILDALKGVDGVLADPAPDVVLWELADFSQNLRVRWWSKPHRAGVVELRGRVLEAVAQALAGAGIDLPFPTQVVLLHDQTDANDGDRTKQREGWPAGKSPPAARPIGRS